MAQYPPSFDQWGGSPPLDWPHYGIGLADAVKRGFAKYATFSGRAGRGEYWWWVLFVGVVVTVLWVLAAAISIGTSPDGGQTPGGLGVVAVVVLAVFTLAILVPHIAVTVRRLHDAGFSGLLYLLTFVPFGGLVVSILCILATSPKAEQYGPPQAPGYQPSVGYTPSGYSPPA